MISLLTVFRANSQQMFVARGDGILELVTVTNNGYTSTVVQGCQLYAYTIAKNGNKFYYANGDLYAADIVTAGGNTSLTNCKIIANGVGTNTMTADNNGVVYYVSLYNKLRNNALFAVYPGSNTKVFLGYMPYDAAGDLIFYKNELYMAGYEGIIKVPLNDPSKCKMFIPIKNFGIWGLASAVIKGKNTVYTLEADVTYPTKMHELDMEGQRVKKLAGSLPYYTVDAASDVSDADIALIEPPQINVTSICNAFNKAHVEILCKPHAGTYTFTLNTGQKNRTGIFDDIGPGSYTVYISSNKNTPRRIFSFTVQNHSLHSPITATTKNPLCKTKGEIKLDAGAANLTYSIKYNNNIFGFDHTFINLDAGNYHFTILNAKGCIVDEKDYILKQDACPIILSKINLTQECDVYNKGRAEIICYAHSDVYTFSLNNGQTNTSGVFDTLIPGDYKVVITSDNNAQPVNTTFTVKDFTAGNPIISANQKNPVCTSKGEIRLDAGAGNSSYKIKYGNDIFGFDHKFTGLNAGGYHFTILNDKGCIADEKDYTLTQEACPPVGILNAYITQECNIFNKGRLEIVCNPHTNQYTFTLDNGQTNTTGIFDNLDPGKYKATVTSNGNESPADVNFTVDDFAVGNPAITFIPKNPVCDLKGELKLNAGIANSAYSIKYGNDVFGFDHVFTNMVAGKYHFTILSANGCVADEKDYVLRQDACPPIIISNVDVKQRCDIFNQASIQVSTAYHPDTYSYTLAGISNTTGIFDALKPGTYNLVITSSDGDRKEQQVIVPDFSLSPNTITYNIKNVICSLPGEIKFTAMAGSNGANQIQHGTDVYTFDQTIKGLTSGINNFIILNQQGCIIDVLYINIPQDDCNPIIFPNSFTPNGDGTNDIFRSNQDANPLKFQLSIYSRWGTFIFKSQSILKGWDGTYNGKPVPFGVFYWVASYTRIDGKDVAQSGYVTLIR
jgi:gliding motility-associated-like protein